MRSVLIVLVSCLLLSGCNMLPEPGSLIQAPKSASATSIENESIQSIAKKYLPKGTTLVMANAPLSADSVLFADLNGDGQEEVIAFYQSKMNPDQIGMFVLEKQKGDWKKVFAKKGLGYDVNWASSSDLTGNGKNDLLVGWKIGNSAGNVLEVYSWGDEGLKPLTKVNYHLLESIQIQDKPETRLAVWKKDVNDIYDIQLLKWENGALIADEEHYPTYFPKVVDYYKSRIDRVPDASYYWYYLADAQLKSNHPEQALNSIEKGMTLKTIVPSFNQFTELHGKIEKKLREYSSSDVQYEVRDADITLDIPKEIARYITVEEGNAPMDGNAVSVFVKSEEKKDLLFTIYIHSKDMSIPESEPDLEQIAENDQYVYFAKRNKESIHLFGLNPEEKNIYEQSIAQVDKMIANIRPGLVSPLYTSLEESNAIKMITEASNKYWYVTGGGNISGEIDTFISEEGLEYRYMGSDLDTREKLNAFLGDSYTTSAIQAYINRANIMSHSGKLAQPNADGGSIVNHEKAIVIGIRDNGNEKEFDLKVPLGTSFYYEFVHVVFTKTKDGWRISSDIGTF